MRFLKNYNEATFFSSMYIILISMFNFITGIFFTFLDKDVNTPTYGKMSDLFPFEFYGLIMITSAICLFVSLFQFNKRRYIFMLIGGVLGAFSIGLYASASTIGATNIMLPLRYSLITCSCFIISIVGGVSLWAIKKNS